MPNDPEREQINNSIRELRARSGAWTPERTEELLGLLRQLQELNRRGIPQIAQRRTAWLGDHSEGTDLLRLLDPLPRSDHPHLDHQDAAAERLMRGPFAGVIFGAKWWKRVQTALPAQYGEKWEQRFAELRNSAILEAVGNLSQMIAAEPDSRKTHVKIVQAMERPIRADTLGSHAETREKKPRELRVGDLDAMDDCDDEGIRSLIRVAAIEASSDEARFREDLQLCIELFERAQLPPRQAEVALGRALGRQFSGIAEEMGISESTAGTHWELASKKLRVLLDVSRPPGT